MWYMHHTRPSPRCLVAKAQPPQFVITVSVVVCAKNVQSIFKGGGLKTSSVQVGAGECVEAQYLLQLAFMYREVKEKTCAAAKSAAMLMMFHGCMMMMRKCNAVEMLVTF